MLVWLTERLCRSGAQVVFKLASVPSSRVMATLGCDDDLAEDHALGRSSGPQVLTQTFLLTISPKEPVTTECQNAVVNYARINCVYAYVVVETGRSGKLHLHAVLIYDSHKERKKLQENITNRLVRKNGHPEAKNGLAVKVQVCPGHKWYDEYLRKESGVVVRYDNYDRDAVTAYFPTEAVQEFLQTHVRSSGAVDKHMAEHKRRWIEFSADGSYESAIKYLKTRMYVLEDMVIIQDKRRLCQLAYALHEYRNQLVEPNAEELSHCSKMVGWNFSVPGTI